MKHTISIALASLLLAAACSSSPQSEDPTPVEASPPTQTVSGGEVTPEGDLRFNLEVEDRERFDAITASEFCPCDGRETESLASCISSPQGACHTAWLAASILGAGLDSGLEPSDAIDLMIHDIDLAQKPVALELEGRPFKGSAEASVVIVEFADLQCPYCYRMALQMKAIYDQVFGEEIAIYFKHFPLSGHPYAFEAAVAAQAAHLQGQFWAMHDALFEHQHELDDEVVVSLAEEIGLDMERFQADRKSEAVRQFVEADRQQGMDIGIRSTPTVYVNGIDLGNHLTVGRIVQRIAFELAYAQARDAAATAAALEAEPEYLIAQEGGLPRIEETAQEEAKDDTDRYPGLFLMLLSEEERKRFFTITEGEVCPCPGSMKSLDACLREENNGCTLSRQVAKRSMRLLKEGSSDSDIIDAMLKDIETAQKVHEFDLSQTPWKGAEPGTKDALVIVEFADFECPYCARASAELGALASKYPEKITLYFKNFPLSFHANAELAARAALAAHEQGLFWPMHDAIFAHQEELSPETIQQLAEQIGLDTVQFKADLESSAITSAVTRDRAEGEASELEGTPTFFINGVRFLGGADELEAAILDRIQ